MKYVAAALNMAGLMLNAAVLVLLLAGWRRQGRERAGKRE